jgi:phosphoglycolate phosphatase
MMTYQAVLFDLDGTLLDTLQDLADSMNAALISLGFPTHETESYKYLVGDGVDTLARRVLPEDQYTPVTAEECIRRMREEYDERWLHHTCPYDGIPELLDGLTQRRIRMAILSNKPHNFTVPMIETLLPSWRFEVILGAKADVPKKPDPTAALQISNQMKIPPAEFLYLGDTNTDMKTAVAAGMFPVGVLWGFRTADELLENGAQALIEKPLDVLDLL